MELCPTFGKGTVTPNRPVLNGSGRMVPPVVFAAKAKTAVTLGPVGPVGPSIYAQHRKPRNYADCSHLKDN